MRPTLLLALLCIGCHGPAAPSLAPESVALDALTLAPVEGVQVEHQGSWVIATAPGYLKREQRDDEAPLTLWREEPAYVQALVYHEWSPAQKLARWVRIPVACLDAVELPVPIAFGCPGDIELATEPDNPYVQGWAAVTFIDYDGSRIIHAKIVCAAPRFAENPAVVLHELGHALGLGHSPRHEDLMYWKSSDKLPPYFTQREFDLLTVVYRRGPGNGFEDVEGVPGVAVEGVGQSIVRCS